MQPQEKNRFGRSNLEVSAFGFGTAPVGNIFEEIDEKTCRVTISAEEEEAKAFERELLSEINQSLS